MTYADAQDRDANRQIINSYSAFKTVKTLVFDGTAGRGAIGALSLYNVTGMVCMDIYAHCTDSLLSATGVISVGNNSNSAQFIDGQSASFIDAGHIVQAGISATQIVDLHNNPIMTTSSVTGDVSLEAITAGTLVFYCLWRPISQDGSVVAV